MKTKKLEILQFEVQEEELHVHHTNHSVKELKIYDTFNSNPQAFKNFITAFKSLEVFTLEWEQYCEGEISIDILKKMRLVSASKRLINIIFKTS